MGPADDQGEVGNREHVYNLRSHIRFLDFLYRLRYQIQIGIQSHKMHYGKHQYRRDSCGTHKNQNQVKKQFSYLIGIRYVGNGSGNREENQRYQEGKQKI